MDSAEVLHIEKNNENYRVYNSVVLGHRNLSILGSEVSVRIINELARNPACAMDVVRNIGADKQKVYYYLKKLEKSGLIKLTKSEQRHGMTAKVYEVVAPVVSAKLYEKFREEDLKSEVKKFRDARMVRFFQPFINDGRLDAKVILGDPYPHGKYDTGCSSSAHVFELSMMMGRFLEETCLHRLDTETRDSDLEDNLIIIGDPKGNTVTEKLVSTNHLPVQFDQKGEWVIESKLTGKRYSDPRTAVILKWDNPFGKGKKILLLAGIRTRGMRAASLAIMNHMDKILDSADERGNFLKIVEGMDRDGDMVIDSVKFLE